MFVILTSKPGEYHTELGPGLLPVERYDYVFFGQCKARFVIAELQGDVRVVVVDETPPQVVNRIPSKFLQKYQTLDQARAELQHLVRIEDAEVGLVRTQD
jgi:hypothetical protein